MNKIGISLGWNYNGAIHGVQTGIRKKRWIFNMSI